MLPHHQATPGNDQPISKGEHSRGYLPHCDHAGRCQFITFSLADARVVSAARGLSSSKGEHLVTRSVKSEKCLGWLDLSRSEGCVHGAERHSALGR